VKRFERCSAAAQALALAQRLPGAARPRFLTLRALLPSAGKAFFAALACSLLLEPTLISQLSSFSWMLLSRWISFLLFLVWALAYGAVSFLPKESACELPTLLFQPGLEISLLSETTPHVFRFPRIDRAGVVH
jgi:hypothetical protein